MYIQRPFILGFVLELVTWLVVLGMSTSSSPRALFCIIVSSTPACAPLCMCFIAIPTSFSVSLFILDFNKLVKVCVWKLLVYSPGKEDKKMCSQPFFHNIYKWTVHIVCVKNIFKTVFADKEVIFTFTLSKSRYKCKYINVHVYSPDIPVGSADYNLQPWYWNTLFNSLISSGENSAYMRTLLQL